MNRSSMNQLIITTLLIMIFICFIMAITTVESSSVFKAHRKFAKHLYKFIRKEKKFFKKKGIEVAALAALSSVHKKKIPIPFPLPIPVIKQPIIHEPIFYGGKFAEKGLAKGAALDLLAHAKTGGLIGHGGFGHGGVGGLGHLGLGGLHGGIGGIGGFI
ncbi:hypothetical protein DERF_012348 [Dermatophagoides farinae]|uniref:Uncharacterized protein n=2 Tax=Dermatophagoides farinae TaxID=6954 RepID=A0A922HPE7_DERFA|nr:hypothetical protein DERF_012348 [Dermatophagoides farinae]